MKKSKPIRALKVVDIVRKLLRTNHGDRHIAAITHASKTTVRRYRALLEKQKITDWGQLATLSPEEVVDMFNKASYRGPKKAHPNWKDVHAQMQRKHVTAMLVWTEYRKANPNGLSYSHFTDQYNAYLERQPAVMRQKHIPGQKVEMDWSGDKARYIDPATNEMIFVDLFVCVLPASSLMFALCMPTQRSADFIDGIVRMFDYFGGVPVEVVCDNHKAGWLKPLPDPTVHPAFQDCCRYYGAEPSPVRPYHPRDKATVECSVGYLQRQVLAPLRDQLFHSLDELNEAVAARVEELNNQPMQLYKESRRARFERFERDKLMPLPAERYSFNEYVEIPHVPQDYHVEIRGHFYSVPHQFIGERVDARISRTSVEILHMRRMIAQHRINDELGGHTTLTEHQTAEHRHQATRSPEGIKSWATTEGGHVQKVAEEIFKRAAQPFVALRACEELRTIVRKHGSEAAQRACGIAMEMKSSTISSIKRVLAMESRTTKKFFGRRRKEQGARPNETHHETDSVGRNPTPDAQREAVDHGKTVRALVPKARKRK